MDKLPKFKIGYIVKHIINHRIIKNLKLLLIISSLLLITCKGDENDKNISNTFLEKYNNTFWKNQAINPNWMDYFGFSKGNPFLQIVYIEGEKGNEIICGKIYEGGNLDGKDSYNVTIKKNNENELWVDLDWPNLHETIKFIVNTNVDEMTAIHIMDGKITDQNTFKLTNLSFDTLCN